MRAIVLTEPVFWLEPPLATELLWAFPIIYKDELAPMLAPISAKADSLTIENVAWLLFC